MIGREALCHFVPLQRPPPIELAGRHQVWVSVNLVNTICCALVIPCDPTLLNLQAHPTHFQQPFHANGLSWLGLWTLLKCLKDSQTPYKWHLASACPIHLAKWPQTWHYWKMALVHRLASPSASKPSTSSNHLQITL